MDFKPKIGSEATYKMVQSGTVVMDESKLQENFHTGNMELMSLIIFVKATAFVVPCLSLHMNSSK